MTLSGKKYLCSAGETFDSVARVLYGSELYAPELMTANPSLTDKGLFTGGEELKIPVLAVSDDAFEEARMPEKAPWKEDE